jgi:hypothetical protein
MTTRTRESLVSFRRPFTLRNWDGTLPAGTYRVLIDEAEVADISFLAYHRVATLMHVPAVSTVSATHSVIDVDPDDLDRALAADAA